MKKQILLGALAFVLFAYCIPQKEYIHSLGFSFQ